MSLESQGSFLKKMTSNLQEAYELGGGRGKFFQAERKIRLSKLLRTGAHSKHISGTGVVSFGERVEPEVGRREVRGEAEEVGRPGSEVSPRS